MNTNVFYHQYTEESTEWVTKSELWPVILTVHYNSGGKLFVTYQLEGEGKLRVYMGTIEGFQVCCIESNRTNKTINIYGMDNRIFPKANKDAIIESKNSRYISQKLRDTSDGAGKYLVSALEDAEKRLVPNLLHNIRNEYVMRCPNNRDTLSPSYDQTALALKLLFEKQDEYSVTDYNRLKDMYETVKQNEQNYAKYTEAALEMFAHEKYLIWRSGGGSLLLAQMNMTPMVRYVLGAEQPKDWTFTLPFRMYSNLEHVPEPVKSNLMASLAFCSVHRQGMVDKCHHWDEQNLLPSNVAIFHETSSMSAYVDNTQLFICNKQ